MIFSCAYSPPYQQQQNSLECHPIDWRFWKQLNTNQLFSADLWCKFGGVFKTRGFKRCEMSTKTDCFNAYKQLKQQQSCCHLKQKSHTHTHCLKAVWPSTYYFGLSDHLLIIEEKLSNHWSVKTNFTYFKLLLSGTCNGVQWQI